LQQVILGLVTFKLEELEKDLAGTPHPVIVFIHQQLDGEGPHTVRNAKEIRDILEKSKKVLAVFQGHNHAGAYSRINDIHYYTLKAMVEGSGAGNNSYAIAEVDRDLNITVKGYKKAISRALPA
jgi:alkaline phosphatase